MKTVTEMKAGKTANGAAGVDFGRKNLHHSRTDTEIGVTIAAMIGLVGEWTPETRQEFVVASIEGFGEGGIKSPAGVAYSSYSRRLKRAAEKAGYSLPKGTMVRNTGTEEYDFPLHLDKLPEKEDKSKELAPSDSNETTPDTGTPVSPTRATDPAQLAKTIIEGLPEDVTLYQVVKHMVGGFTRQQVGQLARHLDKANGDGIDTSPSTATETAPKKTA